MEKIKFKLKLKAMKISISIFLSIAGLNESTFRKWAKIPFYAESILILLQKMELGERAKFIAERIAELDNRK